jgi:tetratricopeptide (TPR) repeat protein
MAEDKKNDATVNLDSPGDHWFKLAMAKYVKYLNKKSKAKGKWQEWESRKKGNRSFDDVKSLKGEVRKLKVEAEGLDDGAESLYRRCEDCFKRSFEEYGKEYNAVPAGEAPCDGLFERWGDAVYALAIIRRAEYFCEGSKRLFDEAAKRYEGISGVKSGAVKRKLGNAFYELAAIAMDNSSYMEADKYFEKATEQYVALKEVDVLTGGDFRNWGNALFERGLIAWRRYTFLKVNCSGDGYEAAIAREVKGLPRYRVAENGREDSLGCGIVELRETVNDSKDMDDSYKTAEGYFKLAVEKYDEIDTAYEKTGGKKGEYEDVVRSRGEMFLVYGRKKRYDYLSKLEEIKSLDKGIPENKEKAEKLQKDLEAMTAEALRYFEEAVEKFEKAVSLVGNGGDDEKKKLWGYIGVAYYRMYLTRRVMGSGERDRAEESKKKAGEYFRMTKSKILDILVDLSVDISYATVNDDVLFALLDDVEDNEDAVFFRNVMNCRKNGGKRLEKKAVDNYKEAYLRSMYIISKLEADNEFENVVAHYANRTVSRKMLFGDDKFRLNCDYYFNDPQEGKLLLDYLFEKPSGTADMTGGVAADGSGYVTFAGCFSFNYDSLTQFRLYGKEKKAEGSGLSLVFNKTFFSAKLRQDRAASLGEFESLFKRLLPDGGWKGFKKSFESHTEDEPSRGTLFRCVYFDPVTDRVDTVGQKERYLFYRENEDDNAYDRGRDYRTYRCFIRNVVKNVNTELGVLRRFIREERLEPEITGSLILKLRYLIKHVAFKVEQECRLVKNCRIADKKKDETISDGGKESVKNGDLRVHVNYPLDVPQHIKEVYFGPEATGLNMFKDYLAYNGLERIECKKSSNPFVGDSTKEFRAENEKE